MLELHDEESANNVKEKWNTSIFGGNDGIANPGQQYCNEIITEVDDEFSELQIKEEITKQYQGAAIETFIFTGTVKINFFSKQLLEIYGNAEQSSMLLRGRIHQQAARDQMSYCKRQKFDHVSARCRNRVPVCGKCSSKQHETKDCSVSNAKDYKCYHCHKLDDDITGDKMCPIMKEKVAELVKRYSDGY